jgi:ferritin-like metal-binding protein YciE
MATTNEVIRPLFITGLRDVHAVEHQALALIDRQLDRLAHYPDIEARLRSHRAETEEQITRVEQILADLGESHSGLKDLGLSISGNLAALSHTVAGDEIIKNSFANFAFENFEIASYTGLITLAQDGGFGSVTSLLEQSLAEEQSMAQFVIGGIPHVMRTFVDLRVAGEDASH